MIRRIQRAQPETRARQSLVAHPAFSRCHVLLACPFSSASSRFHPSVSWRRRIVGTQPTVLASVAQCYASRRSFLGRCYANMSFVGAANALSCLCACGRIVVNCYRRLQGRARVVEPVSFVFISLGLIIKLVYSLTNCYGGHLFEP